MKEKTHEIQSRLAALRRKFWWRLLLCLITCFATVALIVAALGIAAILMSIAALCSIISVIYHQRRLSRLKHDVAT